VANQNESQQEAPQLRAKGIPHYALLVAFVAGAFAAWIIISYNSEQVRGAEAQGYVPTAHHSRVR